jgi:hypothetical protein
MKKKIETNTTINVYIGDKEFNLTKEEAEELYNSLKNSLGKDILKITSSVYNDRIKNDTAICGRWEHSDYPKFPEIIC